MKYLLEYSLFFAFYLIPFIMVYFFREKVRGWRKRIFLLILLFYLELGAVFLFSFIVHYFTNSWETYHLAILIGYNFIWLNPLFVALGLGCLIWTILPQGKEN
jgi:FtsH-binding integral membrane protein